MTWPARRSSWSAWSGRETILKEALAPVMAGYDYVLVDCPPSLGLLTLNALTTVREVFIPLQTEFFALQGMTKLMETIRIVRRRLNPDLQVTGIIACMYDGRTKLAQEVCANIEEYFPGKMFTFRDPQEREAGRVAQPRQADQRL